ncbi:hypothetical protein ACYTR9_04105, partial [Vibrio antiquarius]
MYKKTILSASILIALSQTAYAEEVSKFEEVVVSATRTNQTMDTVAASVGVISEKEIEENMVKD